MYPACRAPSLSLLIIEVSKLHLSILVKCETVVRITKCT